MLRMPSFNVALLALVLSALLVILLAVLIGLVATGGSGRADEHMAVPGAGAVVEGRGEAGDMERPADAAGPSKDEVEAWEAAKAGALVALEGLRGDIQTLSALSVLQTRLLEWNTQLLESGAGLTSLEASLCEEAEVRVWCELLPVTFGRAGEGG